jgi:hypothetical protein
MNSGMSLNAQPSESVSLENLLSVYIFNFTKFIEWPDDKSEEFHICIWGENKIKDPLNTIADKETVKNRKIVIEEINEYTALHDCNIIFFPNDDEKQFQKLVDETINKDILLITNAEGFAEKGASINFIQTADKIKFEINKKSFEVKKIKPHSRLLSLAVNVYE